MPQHTPWRHDTAYEQLAMAYRPIFEQIGINALAREQSRQPSPEEFCLLKEAGFGRLRIPERFSGSGARLSDVFFLSAELATVDPNIAHSWRNHFSFIEDRLHATHEAGGKELLAELGRSGGVIGGGFGEKEHTPDSFPATTMTKHDDATYRLTGNKYYSTGSIYADWSTVLTRIEQEKEPVVALVAVDQSGVEVDDDWDGFGQQITGSGSVYYREAVVSANHILPYRQRYDYAPHFYQTFLHAVLVGIGRAAVRDLAAALKSRSRAHRNNVSEVPAEDPQLLQVVGEVSALVHAADSVFTDSVRSVDYAVADHTDQRPAALDESRATVAAAQVTITDNVLRAATLLFDALGASSTSQKLSLDRHWRNARTIATHNPRVARARHLGDYLVNGHFPQ